MQLTHRLALALLASIATAIAAHPAHADDAADPDMQGPPTKSPSREGPTISLAFGPGEIHIIPDTGSEERIEGGAFSLRAGVTLSQISTFELLVDFVDNAGSTRSTIIGGAIKFYANDPLYIRAGGGLGVTSLAGMVDPVTGEGGGAERYYGAAGIFAVGYEWFQLRDLGLFGEFEATGNRLLKSGVDRTVVNAALMFGITWY